jgi:acetyl esterase/lipase
VFGSRRKQVVKTKFVVSALVLLAVIMLSLLAFLANQPENTTSTNENVANLLPEITNCTVQTDVSYSNDSSPYRVMDVYLPVGKGPFPAIIYVHGGGWVRGSRSDYNYTAAFYAQRGIAGFAIDYTLSTPNETAWPNNIQDVVESVRFIKENANLWNIDPDRLAVLGYSAGAQLASLEGTLSGNESFIVSSSGDAKIKSQVRLVIDYSGATDLEYIGKYQTKSTIYNITTNALGNVSYKTNPDLWVEASPATYISSDDPIFCIIHGTSDMVVPIQVAESFVAKLQAAGVETHFIKIPNGDHQILTNYNENLIARYSLEPLLKEVFHLDQPMPLTT